MLLPAPRSTRTWPVVAPKDLFRGTRDTGTARSVSRNNSDEYDSRDFSLLERGVVSLAHSSWNRTWDWLIEVENLHVFGRSCLSGCTGR